MSKIVDWLTMRFIDAYEGLGALLEKAGDVWGGEE